MTSLSDDQYRALARFRKALRLYASTADHAARQVGITPAQHQLLVAIRGAPSETAPNISWLAEELSLENHSATGLVQRAERAGLVTTKTSSTDGRVRNIALTRHGRAILTRLFDAHSAEIHDARQLLLEALQRVQDRSLRPAD